MPIGSLILLLIAAAGAALMIATWPRKSWLPEELRRAEAVWVEKRLTVEAPFWVVGRLDRVYRLAGGTHTPLEFKNRNTTRLFESDRAQLSLQAWLLRKSGKPTTEHGWLVVQERKSKQKRALKVDLGDDAYCERLIRRYLAVRDGQLQPVKADDARCNACAHKAIC